MKSFLPFFMLIFIFSSVDADVSVDGYYRKDDTYVQPHHRSDPNDTKDDNWSTKGNENPYTGKEGTKDPDKNSYNAQHNVQQLTQNMTADQVKQFLINQSIQNYPGTCPCPYSTARDGSTCGGRSAYSRSGGYQPLCYPQDVSDQMVNEHQ